MTERYRMFNSIGQQVIDPISTQMIDNMYTIEMAEEKSGLYFIQISNEYGDLILNEMLIKL